MSKREIRQEVPVKKLVPAGVNIMEEGVWYASVVGDMS